MYVHGYNIKGGIIAISMLWYKAPGHIFELMCEERYRIIHFLDEGKTQKNEHETLL